MKSLARNGHSWRGNWLGLLSWLLVLALGPSAQGALRIAEAKLVSGNIALSWSGADGAFRLESAGSLAPADWQPLLLTAETNALLGLTDSPAFFRVVAVPSPVSTNVTDWRRLEILESVRATIATLSGDDARGDGQALVQFLSRIPEIAVARLDGSDVSARFHDGRPLLIINNAAPITDRGRGVALNGRLAAPSSIVTGAADRAPMGLGGPPARTGIPASPWAFFFKNNFADIATTMADELATLFRHRGYQVRAGLATLQALMDVQNYKSDVGLIYIDSHGGVIHAPAPEKDPVTGRVSYPERQQFFVQSATTTDSLSEKEFDRLLDLGVLAYSVVGPSSAKGLAYEHEARRVIYAFNARFVTNFWHFGANSYVYVDTCYSGTAGAQPFRLACFTQGAAAAAGWTDKVHFKWCYEKATRRFFDIWLGANELYPADPPQRPFDLVAVVTYMRQNRFDEDQTEGFPGARLNVFLPSSGSGALGLLAPSIQWMRVDEENGQLHIFGLFDPSAPATCGSSGREPRRCWSTRKATAKSSVLSRQVSSLPPAMSPSSSGAIPATPFR